MEEERRRKRDAIEALGVDVYPTRFDGPHPASEAFPRFQDRPAEQLQKDPVRVRTAGRILALRPFGKAGFAHLSDGAGKLQVYIRKDTVSERDFTVYENLDLGDFIGVEGPLFRTKTGELTVRVEALHFLAKAMKPLPEKGHGLTEVEARYRQSYLDPLSNPDHPPG